MIFFALIYLFPLHSTHHSSSIEPMPAALVVTN